MDCPYIARAIVVITVGVGVIGNCDAEIAIVFRRWSKYRRVGQAFITRVNRIQGAAGHRDVTIGKSQGCFTECEGDCRRLASCEVRRTRCNGHSRRSRACLDCYSIAQAGIAITVCIGVIGNRNTDIPIVFVVWRERRRVARANLARADIAQRTARHDNVVVCKAAHCFTEREDDYRGLSCNH